MSRTRARRGSVSRRPPSLAGRRAAFLAGGEEGAVALASASRSSPAHAPARRARAHSPRPPPVPAPRSAAGAPTADARASRRQPHTARRQPLREAAGNGRSSVADPEALPPPPRGCHGCEPGSGSLAPVAAGWKAKAWEYLKTPSSGEGAGGVYDVEVRREGRTIRSPWARGSPSPRPPSS